MLGQTLQQSGDLSGAIQAFENTVRIDLEFRAAITRLATVIPTSKRLRCRSHGRSRRVRRTSSTSAARMRLRRAISRKRSGWLEPKKDGEFRRSAEICWATSWAAGDLISALGYLEKRWCSAPASPIDFTTLPDALVQWVEAEAIEELRDGTGSLGRPSRAFSERRESPASGGCAPRPGACHRPAAVVRRRPGGSRTGLSGHGDLDRAIGELKTGRTLGGFGGAFARSGRSGRRPSPSATQVPADAHNLLGPLSARGRRQRRCWWSSARRCRLRLNFAEAHNKIGLVLAEADDGQGAITELREALLIQPDHVDALTNLGAAPFRPQATAPGDPVLEKAVALAPSSLKA